MNAVVSECLMPETCDNLEVRIAETEIEIEQALRLRNQKFSSIFGLERDRFDEYCDHLIVTSGRTGSVVGTCRLLPGPRAADDIGFYAETEFNLKGMPLLKSGMLEFGRCCIDHGYRNSQVIQMVWEGIAEYCRKYGYSYLIGCTSMRLKSFCDLNEIYSFLLWRQVITARYGTCPLPAYKIDGLQWLEIEGCESEIMRVLPSNIKGYHWLGAELSGEPAYDKTFGSINFLMVIETKKFNRQQNKHLFFLLETGGM